MYGLDLFSGIGGITKALEGYVTPIAYCENHRYAQSVLLSRMATGDLAVAPIWDDVRTLSRLDLQGKAEIIYGGFPCQDISVAGRGEGLGGKRSGLFFEVIRLVSDIRPRFVFLENVSAITVRGAERVIAEFSRLRYDCRWGLLSASDVGANHRRERWWLLAYSKRIGGRQFDSPPHEEGKRLLQTKRSQSSHSIRPGCTDVENASGIRLDKTGSWKFDASNKKLSNANGKSPSKSRRARSGWPEFGDSDWWAIEPNVGRVAHGIPQRVDRLTALGNAVVPAQAREAFERLMGLK